MEDGRSETMAAGQVLEHPGWQALKAMPAEDLKRWLIAQEHVQPRYVAVVAEPQSEVATHRGRGAVRHCRRAGRLGLCGPRDGSPLPAAPPGTKVDASLPRNLWRRASVEA